MIDRDPMTRPEWPMVVVLCVAILLLALPADASRNLSVTTRPNLDGPVVGPSDLARTAQVRRELPFFSVADLGTFSGGRPHDYDDPSSCYCIYDGPGGLTSSTEGEGFVHPHLFQGLWTDPVTGISYARNRWYDARTASWLSEDPMGAVDSPNLYAFVAWQPHAATDPMGEKIHLIYDLGDSNLTDEEWEEIRVNIEETFAEANVEVVFHKKGAGTIPGASDLGLNDRIQSLSVLSPEKCQGEKASDYTAGAHSTVCADRTAARNAPAGGFVFLMSNKIAHEMGHGTGVLLHYDWHLADPREAGEMYSRGYRAMPLGSNFYSLGEGTVMHDETKSYFYLRRLSFSSSDKTILEYYFE